jgi:dihydroorotate dehydrogenase (fumarate)
MDLRTRYLGLELKHPIVASASSLTRSLDDICRLADAGASAVVMASVFEEQVVAEELREAFLLEEGAETQGEASGYFPERPDDHRGLLDAHLETLRLAAERAGVPIIASLNGASQQGWVAFARRLEQAGASAIELNVYRVPADPRETGESVEASYLEIVRAVKAQVHVPVAVKLAPYFSSPGNMALRLVEAGADGIVMFSRFYEPDIDLQSLTARSDLELSTASEARLPLTWVALLAGRLDAALAAGSGIESHEEVVKYLLVGADVVMTASSLLRHGPEHMGTLVRGLETWMTSRGFGSIGDLRGRLAVSRRHADPAAFMRAQYYEILSHCWAAPSSTAPALQARPDHRRL